MDRGLKGKTAFNRKSFCVQLPKRKSFSKLAYIFVIPVITPIIYGGAGLIYPYKKKKKKKNL